MRIALITEGGDMRGFGHLARTCALGQGFAALGHEATLFVDWQAKSPPAATGGIEVRRVNWLGNTELLFPLVRTVDITVMDSYLASSEVFRSVAAHSNMMVSLDDSARIEYPAGVVCNGTPYGDKVEYPHTNGVTYLVGPGYALMRKGFWNPAPRVFRDRIERILVTLGGGPVAPLVLDIVRALTAGISGRGIDVLASPDSAAMLKATLADNPGDGTTAALQREDIDAFRGKIEIHAGVGDSQVASLMAECDAAVTGGGQTLCEAAASGLPAVCVTLADNQEATVASIAEGGAAFSAGRYDSGDVIGRVVTLFSSLNSSMVRRSMSAAGRGIVNSSGALRAAEKISSIVRSKNKA